MLCEGTTDDGQQRTDIGYEASRPVAYLGGGAVVRPPPPFGVVYAGGGPGRPPPFGVIGGAMGGVWLGFLPGLRRKVLKMGKVTKKRSSNIFGRPPFPNF
jgi:hypothetical protein